MRQAGVVLSVAILLSAIAGCATVLDGSDQIISVETRSAGAKVSGARCVLRNDQGESRLTTPGATLVHYDRSDLKIVCTRQGFEARDDVAKSQVNLKVLGNVLVGGVIGFGLDHVSGTAYKYPSNIVVEMAEMPPSAAVPAQSAKSKAGTMLLAMRLDASLDETRTVELVRRTACDPIAKPVLVSQDVGASQYMASCQDGRIVRTVCRQSECRFKTLGD
jgi:hypothetical protein